MTEIIEITWSMPLGKAWVDADPANPFARSVRQLFREGKPFDQMRLCFFQDGELTRWFGSFVQTAAKRILFFPGSSKSFDHIRAFRDQSEEWNRAFELDHLTLEKDLKRWHVTSTGRDVHLGGPKTMPLNEGRVLWFGLSMWGGDVLRELASETKAKFTSPASDVDRRMQILKASRENANFPMLSLSSDFNNASQSYFLHFSVIVGPSGFADYLGGIVGLPFGSPYLAAPLSNLDLRRISMRSHRVQLSEDVDIQIIVSRVPGALKVPLTFTSPSPAPGWRSD